MIRNCSKFFQLLALLCLTSCIPINYHKGNHFGGQFKINLTPEYKDLNANIYLNARENYFLPFLFSYSHLNNPASFRIQFWDYSNKLKTLIIKKFYIKYEGSQEQMVEANWTRVAKAREMTFQSGKKNVRYVWDNTSEFIDTTKSFTIRFEGEIIQVDGNKVNYQTNTFTFSPKKIKKEWSFFEIISV